MTEISQVGTEDKQEPDPALLPCATALKLELARVPRVI